MQFVLTLIGNPATRDLTDSHVQDAQQSLTRAGCSMADPAWLAPDVACDVFFDTECDLVTARTTLGTAISDALGKAPVDVIIQLDSQRRKQLFIADMDSTIINQECLDELADFAGFKNQVSAITKRAMAGEIDFEPALKERVSLLKGLDASVLQQVFETRISLAPGATQLVNTMRANSAVTCLVSGGFTFFTQKVAEAAGFEFQRGNTLLSRDGKLTGEVGAPILGRKAKLEALLDFQEKFSLSSAQSMAVGDGANDVDMIKAAGMGVAIHANQVLIDAADAALTHSDLTALLYLQGYRAEDIVDA